MPQISVILPVKDAAGTLPACLESLSSQSLADFDVWAVDDGSTDESPEILRKHASRDQRFHVVRIEHAGIVEAINQGVRRSSGGLLARMDADDRCHRDRFLLQTKYLAAHPDVDVCSCLIAPARGTELKGGYAAYVQWLNTLVDHDEISLNLFVESPLYHPSVMMRRRALDSVGGYADVAWPEDYDLWLRMAQAGLRFGKVRSELMFMSDETERQSRTDPRYAVEKFYEAKAHYLRSGPLREVDEVIIWGAGRTTRKRADLLRNKGVRFLAYVDLDPRKIGRAIAGVPVIPPDLLVRYPGVMVLSYVGSRGARQQIRRSLVSMGYLEGRDFLCCA